MDAKSNQSKLAMARAMGQQAGEECLSKAEKIAAGFGQNAYDFIVALVATMPRRKRVTGEQLVDAAERAGIKPHDSRAYGPIFQRLIRDGVIRRVGVGFRRKGHGTIGATIYTRGA